jgi:MFS family permease
MAVMIGLLALCPDLVLSTGSLPLSGVLVPDLGTSLTWLQVTNGLSNAAFAIGVVVAAQLALRHVQRSLFLGYAAAFAFGSVLAAMAHSLPLFMVGRVVQGGTTGLMMISALPPLITRFGTGRLPWTVAIVNVGLFGATTLGPIIGGVVAGADAWRALMWLVAATGLLALVSAALGYPVFDPVDPDLPVDRSALVLTAVASLLIFTATSVVAATSLASAVFWMPFVTGVAVMVVLVVVERRKPNSLMPVRDLSTQLPVTGTIVAMVAGATFVTVVELAQLYLASVAKEDPRSAGLLFWPMPVGLIVASVTFGLVFRTRYLPVLVNGGLLALAGGAAVLLRLSDGGSSSPVPIASLLIGFGAGATVTPGLFLAGLGVKSQRLGRAFALVQLLRLTATFAIGPVVVYGAEQRSPLADGVHFGIWVTVVLALLGLALSLIIPALSGARLQAPDLDAWLEDGEQALSSPITGVHLRPGLEDDDAHPLLPGLFHRDE